MKSDMAVRGGSRYVSSCLFLSSSLQAFSEPTEAPAPHGGSGNVPNNNWINLMHDLYTTNLKVKEAIHPGRGRRAIGAGQGLKDRGSRGAGAGRRVWTFAM